MARLVSAPFRSASFSSSARSTGSSLLRADTPSRRNAACAERPTTVRVNVIAPAWAVTISRRVGSVITAASATSPARIAANAPAPPSSSAGTVTSTASASSSTSASRNARMAAKPATTPPFMSTAPRPYSAPSRIWGEKAGVVHCNSSPAATTSMCPAIITLRPESAVPSRPATIGRFVRAASIPG